MKYRSMKSCFSPLTGLLILVFVLTVSCNTSPNIDKEKALSLISNNVLTPYKITWPISLSVSAEERNAEKDRELEFHEALVATGVLKRHSTFRTGGYTLHDYELVNSSAIAAPNQDLEQPSVSIKASNDVRIVIAEPALSKIQEINQRGNDAIIAAEVTVTTTEIYNQVGNAVHTMRTRFGESSCPGASWCDWPDMEKLKQIHIEWFYFKKINRDWQLQGSASIQQRVAFAAEASNELVAEETSRVLTSVFEMLILIAAIPIIAVFARGRGGSPWLWGAIAVVGFIVLRGIASRVGPRAPRELAILALISGWVWVCLVAFYVRFIMGAKRAKPTGLWKCTNCNTLNAHYAVLCDACGQSWEEQSKKSTSPGRA